MTQDRSTDVKARPTVGIYSLEKPGEKAEVKLTNQVPLPDVFKAPIRDDLVNFVHDQVSKNRRQPYAVSRSAGVQCSAASWGTGRAVARIPRVRGSGTHRTGQGAYGNMCRGGHMFNPTTVWRRWYRRVNLKQKRLAVVSGIAASSLPSLVLARGHRISKVPELPLVVDKLSVQKTKAAIDILYALGLKDELDKCKESRRIRIGKGKSRNRRYQTRRGPLIVHNEAADSELVKSFRNIPGVDLINVHRMNIHKLCPGGHIGRLIVWTSDAFLLLTKLYPNQHQASSEKSGFSLPHSMLQMPDISSIINSHAVQSVIRPKKPRDLSHPRKRNPLKSVEVLSKLNPYAAQQKLIAKKVLQTSS